MNLCENPSCEGVGGALHTDEKLIFLCIVIVVGGGVITIAAVKEEICRRNEDRGWQD